MKISKYKKVIKLWGTPRRKVSSSSPCCCPSDPLGTLAPWLIARDKTTHSKCQEGLPRAAKHSSPAMCSYLGERSFWEVKPTSCSLESISSISSIIIIVTRSRSGLRRSITWQISMKWKAIFLHIFASVFFLQFFISLYL